MTLLEGCERTVALALAAPAVNRLGGDTASAELLRETVGTVTGTGEHDGRPESLDDVRGGRDTLFAIDEPEVVLGGVHVGTLRADFVAHRVVLEVGDELGDRAVERGREQQHLTLARSLLDDATHGGQEAHVGHLVGFVDDDGGNVAQVDRPHLDEVFETARAGNDELDTTVERFALAAVADTAVDRRCVVAGGLRERGELGHDLLGEFTSGCEHERNGALRAGVGETRDEREPEAESLPGPGGGAAGNVASGERVGDDRCLDRKGVVLALALEPVHDCVGQAEVAKGNHFVG